MKFKRGNTFDMSGLATVYVNGVKVTDFTGWTGASQIRTRQDVLVCDLTFEWLDTAGNMRIYCPGSTQAWPIGTALIDVEFTDPSGRVVSTDTAILDIGQDVTHA